MRLLIDLQAALSMSAKRGIGRYSLELALAMIRAPRGHAVTVALNATVGAHVLPVYEMLGEVVPREAIAVWHGLTGSSHLHGDPGRRAASEIIRAQALLAHAPDVIHVASMFEGASDDTVTRWPAGLPRPSLATTFYDAIPLIRRETYLDSAWAENGLADWYLGQLEEVRGSDLLLAISQSSASEAITHLGMAPGQVANLRAGVSPVFSAQAGATLDVAAFKARLGLPDSYILFLGAGEPRKNEIGLLRAMAMLPAGLRSRHRAVIVGKMDRATFAQLLADAGLGTAEAVLIPWVAEADLPALYAAATLFVFPSLHEGFGLPALEAMACGTATLASNSSSLPEVVGDPEALFDPTDPASIAERIAAVLGDPALLARMRDRGQARAAEFTWEASAGRAWDALEALPPAPAAQPGRRKLAYVSPLPPAASGIADYSAELLPALAMHYDITLFSAAPTALNVRFPVVSEASLPERAAEFDRVVYQIGNSEFHAHALGTLLPEVPGVVVQHDAYLSGALMVRSQTDPGGLAPLLFEAEGWAGLRLLAREGLNPMLRELTCSLPALRDSLGVIVHSRYAANIQRDLAGPALRLLDTTPHLRAVPKLDSRAAARQALGLAEDALVVTSFGIMAVTKCPDLLVAGFAAAFADDPRAVLVFAGAPEPEPGLALRPAEAAGLKGRVRVTGRLPTETYRRWLAASDIAVQLRRNSRGESSGAIADAMAAGLPVIANAHGTAAELPPEATILLPEETDARSLGEALRGLAANPDARARLGDAAIRHVRETLSPTAVAARYYRAVEAGYAPSANLALHRAIRGIMGTDADRRDAARALAFSFPRHLPRRLLLLGDGLAYLAAAVDAAGRGWHVEALLDTAGGLVLNRVAAATVLGLPAMVPDMAFEPGPSDRLLLMPSWQTLSEATLHAVREARLAGARVMLADDGEATDIPGWIDAIISTSDTVRPKTAARIARLPPDASIFTLATGDWL